MRAINVRMNPRSRSAAGVPAGHSGNGAPLMQLRWANLTASM